MTPDEATQTIVQMVRPTLEAQILGEDFDFSLFNTIAQSESVTRDDLLLMVRLMLPEIIGLARRAGVMTVSTSPVIEFDGQKAWNRIDWLR